MVCHLEAIRRSLFLPDTSLINYSLSYSTIEAICYPLKMPNIPAKKHTAAAILNGKLFLRRPSDIAITFSSEIKKAFPALHLDKLSGRGAGSWQAELGFFRDQTVCPRGVKKLALSEERSDELASFSPGGKPSPKKPAERPGACSEIMPIWNERQCPTRNGASRQRSRRVANSNRRHTRSMLRI